MGEIAGFISAGGAGVLLLAMLYLLNANRLDRKQYDEAVDREVARANAAEQRTRDAYAALDEARRDRHATLELLIAYQKEAVQRRIESDGTGGLT